MKKMKKMALIILLVTFISSIVISNRTYVSAEGFDWGSSIKEVEEVSAGDEIKPIQDVAGSIMVIFKVACMGIAVIMLIVLAMKYMVSAPGDRATIKKHAVVYIVGAVVLFAASGILQIIQKFAEGNIGEAA